MLRVVKTKTRLEKLQPHYHLVTPNLKLAENPDFKKMLLNFNLKIDKHSDSSVLTIVPAELDCDYHIHLLTAVYLAVFIHEKTGSKSHIEKHISGIESFVHNIPKRNFKFPKHGPITIETSIEHLNYVGIKHPNMIERKGLVYLESNVIHQIFSTITNNDKQLANDEDIRRVA